MKYDELVKQYCGRIGKSQFDSNTIKKVLEEILKITYTNGDIVENEVKVALIKALKEYVVSDSRKIVLEHRAHFPGRFAEQTYNHENEENIEFMETIIKELSK